MSFRRRLPRVTPNFCASNLESLVDVAAARYREAYRVVETGWLPGPHGPYGCSDEEKTVFRAIASWEDATRYLRHLRESRILRWHWRSDEARSRFYANVSRLRSLSVAHGRLMRRVMMATGNSTAFYWSTPLGRVAFGMWQASAQERRGAA
jgi:hypothetical protein